MQLPTHRAITDLPKWQKISCWHLIQQNLKISTFTGTPAETSVNAYLRLYDVINMRYIIGYSTPYYCHYSTRHIYAGWRMQPNLNRGFRSETEPKPTEGWRGEIIIALLSDSILSSQYNSHMEISLSSRTHHCLPFRFLLLSRANEIIVKHATVSLFPRFCNHNFVNS